MIPGNWIPHGNPWNPWNERWIPSSPPKTKTSKFPEKGEKKLVIKVSIKSPIYSISKISLKYFVKNCLKKQAPWNSRFQKKSRLPGINIFKSNINILAFLKFVFQATDMWQTALFDILLQTVLFHTLDSTANLVVTTLKAAFTYYCLIISQNLAISIFSSYF